VQSRLIRFVVDEEVYEIAVVLDQWYEPSTTYFKVESTERKVYLLRHDEHEETIRQAERLIEPGECCHP
jgi:hypothetical protein